MLVVDDERDLNELIIFNLQRAGYDVVTAFNGNAALGGPYGAAMGVGSLIVGALYGARAGAFGAPGRALITFRILQAAGAAVLIPSSLALVMHAFPREKVPQAVAIWGATGGVAGALVRSGLLST